MNETDVRNVIKPLLSGGENIIWASRTDPAVKTAVLDEIKQQVIKRVKQYAMGTMFAALLFIIRPAFRSDPGLFIIPIVMIIVLELGGIFFKFWLIKRNKIGGYALTRQHLFELDEGLKVRRKLDASKVRYALRNENGVALAPLGKTLNSKRVLRWLPEAATAEHIQSAIDEPR